MSGINAGHFFDQTPIVTYRISGLRYDIGLPILADNHPPFNRRGDDFFNFRYLAIERELINAIFTMGV